MNAHSFFVSEGEVGEQAPEGSHPARCIAVVDLGTQTSEYNGEKRSRKQVFIQWELPNESRTTGSFAGEVFRVGAFYTRSLHPQASLRADLESWRGRKFTEEELKQFDVAKLLGAPCLLQVGRSDKGRAKVTGVMSVPRGMSVPELVNDTLLFTLDAFDAATFAELPKGIQQMVTASPEYKEATGQATTTQQRASDPKQAASGDDTFADFVDDDLPF